MSFVGGLYTSAYIHSIWCIDQLKKKKRKERKWLYMKENGSKGLYTMLRSSLISRLCLLSEFRIYNQHQNNCPSLYLARMCLATYLENLEMTMTSSLSILKCGSQNTLDTVGRFNSDLNLHFQLLQRVFYLSLRLFLLKV